jgi:hypothetical protein
VYRQLEAAQQVGPLGVEAPAYRTFRAAGGTRRRSTSTLDPRQLRDAALKLVVTMTQEVVAGADGVSSTLPRNGQLQTVVASNDVVLAMDHDHATRVLLAFMAFLLLAQLGALAGAAPTWHNRTGRTS